MKILLMNPQPKFEETYNDYMSKKSWFDKGHGLVPGVSPPLGLLYIASVLREEGHKIIVKDGSLCSIDEIKKTLKQQSPELIGILTTSFAWGFCKEIIPMFKNEFPHIKIICGGPLPDAYKEKCLEDCKSLDFAAFGDGEYILRDLCDSLEKNKDLRDVRGLCFRLGGRIIRNKDMPLIENLDELPLPARDLVDIKRYCSSIGTYLKIPNTTITGSRGCPFRCIFCHITILPSPARYRDPIKVADEMELLVNDYKIKDLLFWDNGLTDNKKWITALCDEIKKRKLDVVWAGNSRINSANYEILKNMEKAGCWRLLYGIESGVQKNLDILRKGQTIRQIEDTIKANNKTGIAAFGSFIFGIPGETFEEGLKTIDFACKLNLDFARFNTMGSVPGTTLYENLQQYGKITSFKNSQTFNVGGFIPYTMSEEDLLKLFNIAYKKFYLRPSYMLKRVLKIRSVDSLKQNIRGFLAFSSAD